MVRNALTIGGLFSITLFTACQAGTEAPPAAPQPEPAAAAPAAPAATRTIREGIFTDAQADRGQEVFDAVCSDCHVPTEWSDASFLESYEGLTVHEFLTLIHDTMPMDAPGSLSRQEYTDVVAYMFRLNNLPTGSLELTTDETGQREIVIDPGV